MARKTCLVAEAGLYVDEGKVGKEASESFDIWRAQLDPYRCDAKPTDVGIERRIRRRYETVEIVDVPVNLFNVNAGER